MHRPVLTSRAAMLSASAGVLLVVAAMVLPRWLDEDVRVHWPPLHADWDPRFGLLTLPAIAIGLMLVLALPRVSRTASWHALLAVAFASTWTWIMALAMTEGTDGLARVFERRQEYVFDAQSVGSIHEMLQTFIERIPFDSPDNWYVHVAGHPPGALLYFVGLDRIGVTDPFWIGVVCVTLASTAIVAVMITLRTLGSERLARSAMPWIVLAPSAVWMGVNGDAVFTAVAAWGLALLAVAATRGRALAAIGAGVLLGYCVFLSYGLVLLGILAVAVLTIARSWRPLPWALGGAFVVTAAFTVGGFAWWGRLPVLRGAVLRRHRVRTCVLVLGLGQPRRLDVHRWARRVGRIPGSSPSYTREECARAAGRSGRSHDSRRDTVGHEQGGGRTHLPAVHDLDRRPARTAA
ncbi:hypothetical protein [Aeromicrobium sp. UC242_57]|uniref:hypothetical protein n=1 Tax=Aeromicrobium sp. UC242_57 TaxID=3374624 RepID=UPI00379A845E